MKWTKLKQLAEELLCDSLKGRVHYQFVVHRKSHDQTGTLRITFDGNEIFRASDIPFSIAVNERELELRKEREIDISGWTTLKELFESEELKRLHAAIDEAEVEVKSTGNFPSWDVKPLLFEYIQMPFEQAVVHEHSFIRAISLFDRRFGNRRIKTLNVENESELVKRFYDIRVSTEAKKVKLV